MHPLIFTYNFLIQTHLYLLSQPKILADQLTQRQASGMDWTLHTDLWKSENLKIVEISKNNFDTI
jgi:hypothetical protein